MLASPAQSRPDTSPETGRIGHIPVRNIWLLMLYASDLFRQLHNAERVAAEENPDDIPDLIAEIMAHAVEYRLKRNLSFGYQTRNAVLGRVRGRIDLLRTERRQLLQRGRVACRFDELTVDTPRNRYVRAALERLAKRVRTPVLGRRCRALAATLAKIGVGGERPSRREVSIATFGRLDAQDRQMVTAAHLAFDLALPTESIGAMHLSSPEREVTWFRRLYEKAIAGFYDVVLTGSGWRVHAGRKLSWPIERPTPGIDQILPQMVTDIVLENHDAGRRIVIDTKFNSILTRGWYRDETLRSQYLYQIYAYVMSQESNDDPLSKDAQGLLIHPAIETTIDESVVIQSHRFRFATVDLGAGAPVIRQQLLELVRQGETDVD